MPSFFENEKSLSLEKETINIPFYNCNETVSSLIGNQNCCQLSREWFHEEAGSCLDLAKGRAKGRAKGAKGRLEEAGSFHSWDEIRDEESEYCP